MKLKNFFTIAIAIFAFTFAGYSQVEQEEAPTFGKVRALGNPSLIHNFGQVTGEASSWEFRIQNTGTADLVISDINLPEQVGVTISTKTIKAKETGIISVSVNPTVMKKGKFTKKIIVTTKQKEPGVVTTKELTFAVSGVIK